MFKVDLLMCRWGGDRKRRAMGGASMHPGSCALVDNSDASLRF